MRQMYAALGVSEAVYDYGERVLKALEERFRKVDAVAEYNQAKVIAAMQKNRVGAACFAATTGYGYDDVGRDNLERVYADTFHTEAASSRASSPIRRISGRRSTPVLPPQSARRSSRV